MISASVLDRNGKEVGTYEFDPADLAPGVNKQLLHDATVMYEANRRVGTFRTKSRGMVSGSTKKLFRQKGTGRARAGMANSPVRRGGGHTFAKKPIDYSYRLPKKAIKLATRMALLSKFLDNEAIILDELSLTEVKTKAVADTLKALGLKNEGCLLTIKSHDNTVWKSTRNIDRVSVLPAADLNAYELLHKKRLVITRAALDHLRGVASES